MYNARKLFAGKRRRQVMSNVERHLKFKRNENKIVQHEDFVWKMLVKMIKCLKIHVAS